MNKPGQGRPFNFDNEEEALQHYISVYYQDCDKTPDIRFKEDQHLQLIDEINKKYLKDLKRHKNFDYETYQNCFVDSIDFLTKAISKRREKLEKDIDTISWDALMKAAQIDKSLMNKR